MAKPWQWYTPLSRKALMVTSASLCRKAAGSRLDYSGVNYSTGSGYQNLEEEEESFPLL